MFICLYFIFILFRHWLGRLIVRLVADERRMKLLALVALVILLCGVSTEARVTSLPHRGALYTGLAFRALSQPLAPPAAPAPEMWFTEQVRASLRLLHPRFGQFVSVVDPFTPASGSLRSAQRGQVAPAVLDEQHLPPPQRPRLPYAAFLSSGAFALSPITDTHLVTL